MTKTTEEDKPYPRPTFHSYSVNHCCGMLLLGGFYCNDGTRYTKKYKKKLEIELRQFEKSCPGALMIVLTQAQKKGLHDILIDRRWVPVVDGFKNSNSSNYLTIYIFLRSPERIFEYFTGKVIDADCNKLFEHLIEKKDKDTDKIKF